MLNLRAHPVSLSAAIINHSDPLRLFRILNHVSSWTHCSITLRKPAPTTTELEFRFRSTVEDSVVPCVSSCLDGVVPEVFDCDALSITNPLSYHLRSPRTAIDKSNNSLQLYFEASANPPTPDSSSITLVNYHRPYVLPSLSSQGELISRLRTDTLLDCGNAALGPRNVTISFLSPQSKTIRRTAFNRTRLQALKHQGAHVYRTIHGFDTSGVLVDLLAWVSRKASTESRAQMYAGAVPLLFSSHETRTTLLAPLQRPLDTQSRQHLGVAVEISAPENFITYDLDDRAVADAHYRDLICQVGEWLDDMVAADDMRALYDAARDRRDIEVARLLQRRQAHMQQTRMVFLSGTPILQEPRSENDVLALYFKLEGASALPVHTCCVLEHTPSRGTDAIGHFRISAADAVNQFALIEFEHRFTNFLTHGHSLRHVDLIICWSASSADPLTRTRRPWLMNYTDTRLHRTVPVLVLSRIPNLEVRNG